MRGAVGLSDEMKIPGSLCVTAFTELYKFCCIHLLKAAGHCPKFSDDAEHKFLPGFSSSRMNPFFKNRSRAVEDESSFALRRGAGRLRRKTSNRTSEDEEGFRPRNVLYTSSGVPRTIVEWIARTSHSGRNLSMSIQHSDPPSDRFAIKVMIFPSSEFTDQRECRREY